MLLKKLPLLPALAILLLFTNLVNAEFPPFFSENEIKALQLTEEEWILELNQHQITLDAKRDTQFYSNKDLSRVNEEDFGPIVSIVDPEPVDDVYSSTAPVRLLVYLKSRIAPINIDTLKVKGKRGFFSLNITDRMKPYMRLPHYGENADYVIDANIPKLGAGHYVLTLSLADVHGNQEEHKAFLEVTK